MACCDNPQKLRNPKKEPSKRDPEWLVVPCGKCFPCIQNKRNQWVTRMTFESDKSETLTWFITLTYNEENLPSYGLDKDRVKKLTKSLRDKWPYIKIYLIGEYGPTTIRPHYHALLFHTTSDQYEIIKELGKRWPEGNIKVLPAHPNGIAYCCLDMHIRNPDYGDKNKPFNLISKGLGKEIPSALASYLVRRSKEYIRRSDGTACTIPRYNAEKLFLPHQLERIKAKRLAYQAKKFNEETRTPQQLEELRLWNRRKLLRTKNKKLKTL